jgi:hypothetical protein
VEVNRAVSLVAVNPAVTVRAAARNQAAEVVHKGEAVVLAEVIAKACTIVMISRASSLGSPLSSTIESEAGRKLLTIGGTQ